MGVGSQVAEKMEVWGRGRFLLLINLGEDEATPDSTQYQGRLTFTVHLYLVDAFIQHLRYKAKLLSH